MNNNIINTTIISLIVAFFVGIIFNATAIAPVAAKAEVEAAEAAVPIKVNAKRAVALKAAIEAVEHDHKLIDKCFNKATGGTGGFIINNKLTLYKDEIDHDLNDIKSMVNACQYNEAEAALKEYKQLLARQVSYCTGWFPFSRMFVIMQEADKLGVYDYWDSKLVSLK